MKKKYILSSVIVTFLLTLIFSGTVYSQSNVAAVKKKLSAMVEQNKVASPKVKQFIKSRLISEITNQVFVNAVNVQNDKKVSLNEIKKIDAEWIKAEEPLKIHDRMMTGTCADQIRSLAGKLKAVGEVFVMDNQGANVCQNELTSDYWQGDEGKWKNSFNNGTGGIEIGTEKLDKSTNLVLQQVSLPLVDNKGKVVGAVCYGIMTGKL